MIEEDLGVMKKIVSTPLALEENELMVVSLGFREPQGVMTKVRRVLALGIRSGLTYDCLDEVTISGITTNIAKTTHSSSSPRLSQHQHSSSEFHSMEASKFCPKKDQRHGDSS